MAQQSQSACNRLRHTYDVTECQPPPSASHFLPTSSSTASSTLPSDPCISSSYVTPSKPTTNSLSHPESSLFASQDSCGPIIDIHDPLRDTNDHLPEIELISVTQSLKSPRYRLRVDPCTAFVGYKHRDFTRARHATHQLIVSADKPPSLTGALITVASADDCSSHRSIKSLDQSSEVPEDTSGEEDDSDSALGLTAEQIERTLDYFLSCSLRVSQMAHTYEDLDAMTHLLEEKQNDLEWAAKVGKDLVERNRELEKRLTETEEQLAITTDKVTDLSRKLTLKESLLEIYSRSVSDDLNEEQAIAWSPQLGDMVSPDTLKHVSLGPINFAILERKIRELQDENDALRDERNRLNVAADKLDEHEGTLIRDCTRQLFSANEHIRTLSDELAKKSDAHLNQQSEITRLLTRGVDLEGRIRQLAAENEMLTNRLNESQASQKQLIDQVRGLQDQYDECATLFAIARDQIRTLRKRSRRACLRSNYISSLSMLSNGSRSTPTQSLLGDGAPTSISEEASSSSNECSPSLNGFNHGTQHDERSLASDLAQTAFEHEATMSTDRLFRAMEQARTVRHLVDEGPSMSTRPAEYGTDDTVCSSGFVSGSEPSEQPSSTDARPRYKPMEPATGNMNTMRDICSSFTPVSVWSRTSVTDGGLESNKRHSWFGCDSHHTPRDTCNSSLTPTSLDDSLLPSDPSEIYSRSYWQFPQRLQLIKPVKGSGVLQHWQRLATPNFPEALFEDPLPGVQSRTVALAHTSSFGVDRNGGIPAHVERIGTPQPPTERSQDALMDSVLGTVTPTSVPSSYRESERSHNRFGSSLPGHLAGSAIRSRSLEHLHPLGHRTPLSPRLIGTPKTLVTTNLPMSSPFSITSLVSALLPFPLSLSRDRSTERRRSADEVTPHANAEPVRIRLRSPQCSRGLLDVSSMNQSTPISLQRGATTHDASPSGNLPAAQPPRLAPHVLANRPTVYPRTVHNTNLSGITEESSSPPKPTDISSTQTVLTCDRVVTET